MRVYFVNLPKGVLDPVKRYFIACALSIAISEFSALSLHLFSTLHLYSPTMCRHNGDIAASAQDATHIVTEPPWTAVWHSLCLCSLSCFNVFGLLVIPVFQELEAILKSNKGVKVVIPDWVIESCKAKRLLPERPYFVERKKQ